MSDTQVCKRCRQEQPIDNFSWSNGRHLSRRTTCRACARSDERERYKRAPLKTNSDEIKVCSLCGHEKPLEEFHIHRLHRDGRHSECKMCQNAENVRRHSQKPSFIAVIKRKVEGECYLCGESDIACLDFHHIERKNGNRKREIPYLARYGTVEEVEAEMDKCHLVCANCHRKEHRSPRIDALVSVLLESRGMKLT